MTDGIDDAVVQAAWTAWFNEYPNAARAIRAAVRVAVLAERERNAHLIEALVAALEETVNALSQCEAGPRIDKARAVLAKAKS